MNNSTLEKTDDSYFNRVWQVVKEIGETERHFNSLESQYRLLSSTWLLSSFVGMGFILKTEAVFPVDKWWLIFAVCIVSGIGIFMLWRIDLLVYHKLLHSAFMVGTTLEAEHKFLPDVRSRMLASQGGSDVTKTVVMFYSVCITLLLSIALFIVIYKSSVFGIFFMGLIAISGIVAIIMLNYYMVKRCRRELGKKTTAPNFEYKFLPENYSHLAPDGSEIRALAGNGHCAHCILPPGKISRAVKHKTIDEIWYVVSGEGEFWGEAANPPIQKLCPGASLIIPRQTAFQFRNISNEPLCILLFSATPWPGENEAMPATGNWSYK